MTEQHLQSKLKNMKDIYRLELKKIRNSEGTGTAAVDQNVPNLIWSDAADSILRDYTSVRPPVDNFDVPISPTRLMGSMCNFLKLV